MAITTLRPNGDVAGKSASWTRSVGGTLFTVLAAGTDSGTDYVLASAGMPQGVHWYAAELNGETITNVYPTGTRRVKAIKIRGNIQNPGDPGRTVQVRTSLRDLATDKNITPPDYLKSTLSGSIVAREGQWHATNPDGSQWTISNLQRLQIEFYSYRSTGGFYIRLHRFFIDVDLKDQPTTTAVSLANTNTTRPVVSGTFTATEGDPLTRARLKVFTAAQVAAAGFNAETSTAVYDSGDQATVSLKLPVGLDLSPGVTYHAYLKGAYTLNGTPFWSAWASQSFALAIEPATAPLLTMTADDTLRRAILIWQGRVNLLSSDDADFEGTIGNWVAGVGAAPARSTAQFRHGVASMLYNSNGTASPFFTNSGGSGGPGAVVTKAGQVFRLSGFFRAGSTGRAWRIVARQHDVANAFVNQTNGSNGTDTTSWTAMPEVTHTATVDGRLYFQLETSTTPTAGELHYFDQLQIVPGSAAVTWSPGGFFPISTARIDAWDRSAGLDNLARLELSACRAGIFKRTAADGLATDPANTQQGADSMAWVPSATGSILDLGWQHGSFTEDYALAGAGGLVAVGSVYAQASVAGNYTAAIDCYDGLGVSVGAAVGSETWALTTGRQRFDVAGTLPAGTVHCKVTLTNATGATGQSVWLSAFQWELRAAGSGVTPNPWVPGQGTAPDWRPIRGMAATVLGLASQRFALSDFEVPPGIVRTYRALVDTTLSGLETTLASTPVAASMAAVWLAPNGTWHLKDPYFPERNAAVRVTGLGESIDPDVAVFHPAGLELPVPFWDSVGGENATGTIQAIGASEWGRLRPLLRNGSTILLDLPEGGHRYYAITQASWPRAGPLGQIQRAVQVDARQVGTPPDLPAYSGLGFVSTSGGVTYDALVSRARAELGVFTSWLAGAKGFIGEAGWPQTADSASWNALAEWWYDDADAASLWVTYWATGEWWGTTYNLAAYEDTGGAAGVDTARNPSAIIEAHPSVGASPWTTGYGRGVNVAGGEFNDAVLPGTYDTDYHYDGQATFDYLFGRGIKLVRLPIRWERIQRTLGGALDSGEVTRVAALLDRVNTAGLQAILDIHNYGRYKISGTEHPIGGGTVTQAHYTDLMTRLVGSSLWAKPALLALGLMNEPHDMPVIAGTFADAPAGYEELFNVNIGAWHVSSGGGAVAHNTSSPIEGAGQMRFTKTWAASGADSTRMDNGPISATDRTAHGLSFRVRVRLAAGGPAGIQARLETFADGADRQGPFVELVAGSTVDVVATFESQHVDSMEHFTIHIKRDSSTAVATTIDIDQLQQGTVTGGAATGPLAWQQHAQAAVNAIRTAEGAGAHKLLLVPLEGWSGAQNAAVNHPGGPWITDSASNFRYEAHHYWDRDNSGDYPDSYAAEVTDALGRGYTGGP
jgi:hypothetical protein